MEFYEVINQRRTVRDFEEKELPEDVLERILEAGIKAPSGNHLREIEFVVIRGKTRIALVLREVLKSASILLEWVKSSAMEGVQRDMYLEAVPKQFGMLSQSGCLLLPFYRQRGDLLRPETQSSLNAFASVWCCVENILLAAVAEGLACALRVPVGDEQTYVAKVVKAPKGYILPCYIGIGYPSKTAAAVKQSEVKIHNKVHFGKW
jgi:nitroreductase